MTAPISVQITNTLACITLDRPQALNALSLEMVRAIFHHLTAWRDDPSVHAVLIRSSSERAFCAGGDIRFLHQIGSATPLGGSALLEDFFTEEYALNHLIHHYPKPFIAELNGIVMGGGMGIAQSGPQSRIRIVTEHTRMAMPEVKIGLFPDVGGSWFLSRAPGELGTYLALTGTVISAADALYAALADHFVPASELSALETLIESTEAATLQESIRTFAAPFAQRLPDNGLLSVNRAAIDEHFSKGSVPEIIASLRSENSAFAQQTLAQMLPQSPLMLCVTLEQLRRGRHLDVAACLRMEREMVRHVFAHGEVLEGVRAAVIDKDQKPHWQPGSLDEVTPDMVAGFFAPVWPVSAHPLRHLR